MGLPIVQPENRIRRSRSTRWRAAVLIAVHLVMAAHIAHWLTSGRSVTPVEPSEAAAFAQAGIVNAGLIFFLATIALTAVFGRFVCGWGCHLVALQDLSRALLQKLGRRPKPLRSRLLAWVPMIAFVATFLWPAVERWRRTGSLAAVETELTTSEFWATFPGWLVGGLTFLVCGFLAIYFLGAKGFCTYACPYGAIFGVVEKLAPLRIRVTDACAGCGHCTAVCTSNVRVHEEVRDFGMVVDSGCMKCLDCVSVCPNDALYYGRGPIPALAKRRATGRAMKKFPLPWAEEGVLAVSFAAAFFTFHGLYGYVPFLFGLGLAGVLAYLVLLTYQLLTRPNVAFKAWSLKRTGRLQRPGKLLVAAMVVLAAFWAHSAAVRGLIARAERTVVWAGPWQGAVFDLAEPRRQLPAKTRERIERGAEAYAAANRLGFIDTLGAAPRLAILRYLLGDDEAAERYAERAIERDELASRMHQLLGRQAFERGDPGSAVSRFERAIAADPYDRRPHTSLGITLAQSGDLAGARRVFEAAMETFGESAALDYNLGLVEAYDGRPNSAASYFTRALELEPGRLPARENLAGTLAALGRLEESAEHYALAVDQSPRDPLTRVLFARVLLALGRPSDAATQVTAALEIAPGHQGALALRHQLPPRD
ncbi:MAG: tetratricopeptide repeat protein [Thermoanaerobaculia bacterium]